MNVFTLLIDVDAKQLLANRFGGTSTLPRLDRGDAPNFEIGFLKYNGIEYDYLNFQNSAIKFGIGVNAATPTDGEFKLTFNGVTSSAISYNASAASVQTAIANAISASVTTVAGVNSAYQITATTAGVFAGTTAGLGGDSFSLYPASSVIINTTRSATAGVALRQIVRLVQSPAVFQDVWANSQTTGGATLSLAQQGSATQSETYSLEIDDNVYAGQYNLLFGNQAAGIAYNATAEQIQTELAKLTSIGEYIDVSGVSQPNVRVSGANGKFGIAFVGNLSQTNIATAFLVNDSALFRPPYKTATVTFNTAQIENFLNSGVTGLSLEIEISDGGNPQTVLSTAVTFNQNDLIVTGSAVPANQAAYLTATEIAAQYVEDSTANVDATNRRLKNSSGTTVVDYEQSLFGNGAVDISGSVVTISSYPLYVNSTLTVGGAVSFGKNLYVSTAITAVGAVSFGGGMAVSGNLGFFGTSPTAQGSGINIANSITKSGIISFTQPTQANVVSNIISLGLIASSPTYGVLPQSPRTLAAVTYTTFGLVPSNNVISKTVTITGCQLNDIVLLGLPADIEEGLAFSGHVVNANQIHIDALNVTGSGKTQNATTFRITVIGY
jgi:hypothetical protein